MPAAVVEVAFTARLAASWTVSSVLSPDALASPPEGVNAFLVVQYPVVNAEKPFLGRRYFEEGTAMMVLKVKSGLGLPTGLAWADTLAGLFRHRKFGGIQTFAPIAPTIDDASDDGNWFELTVIVPYRYQFNG